MHLHTFVVWRCGGEHRKRKRMKKPSKRDLLGAFTETKKTEEKGEKNRSSWATTLSTCALHMHHLHTPGLVSCCCVAAVVCMCTSSAHQVAAQRGSPLFLDEQSLHFSSILLLLQAKTAVERSNPTSQRRLLKVPLHISWTGPSPPQAPLSTR